MGRGRQLSSDDEGPTQDEAVKRVTTQPANQISTGHYDIYALPSNLAPHPSLHSPSTRYQLVSLLVVHRASGLSSGLGLLYSLAQTTISYNGKPALSPLRDPGFFLPRHPEYDAGGAVLLGWVEEERLGWLDGVVAGMGVPRLEGGVGQGVMGCAREWVLGVLGRLEMEGVLSNPELLVAQFFRQSA